MRARWASAAVAAAVLCTSACGSSKSAGSHATTSAVQSPTTQGALPTNANWPTGAPSAEAPGAGAPTTGANVYVDPFTGAGVRWFRAETGTHVHVHATGGRLVAQVLQAHASYVGAAGSGHRYHPGQIAVEADVTIGPDGASDYSTAGLVCPAAKDGGYVVGVISRGGNWLIGTITSQSDQQAIWASGGTVAAAPIKRGGGPNHLRLDCSEENGAMIARLFANGELLGAGVGAWSTKSNTEPGVFVTTIGPSAGFTATFDNFSVSLLSGS